MKTSKSAHIITSCEVYAEVVDAAADETENLGISHKRQSYHCGSSGGAILNSGNNATSRFR